MKQEREKITISLKTEEVRKFVRTAENCEFPIDVYPYQSHYAVDGKSFLGVLTICAKGKIEVAFNGKNEKLEGFLNGL